VVREGRAKPEVPTGIPDGTIAGPGIAYVLVAGGRSEPARLVRNLVVTGDDASAVIDRFGLFG
jgi:hypothetical protein